MLGLLRLVAVPTMGADSGSGIGACRYSTVCYRHDIQSGVAADKGTMTEPQAEAVAEKVRPGEPGYIVPSHGGGLLKPIQKGQVLNPTGKSGVYQECQRIAREHSVEAVHRLVELMKQKDDDRVAFMAVSALLDRAWGKPKEMKAEEQTQQTTVDLSKLSEEHKRLLLEMFRSGVLKADQP